MPEPAGRYAARRPPAGAQAAGLARSLGSRAVGGADPAGKGVAKSVGKEAIKGAAQGAAAGGIGAAAGAAKGVATAVGKAAIKSKKGRAAIACALLALLLPTIILDARDRPQDRARRRKPARHALRVGRR